MFNNELWQKPAGGAGGGDFYSHQIASSIRNSSAQDGTLQWTAGTPTSSTTMTMSYWVKRYDNSAAGSLNNIFVTGTGGAAYIIIGMHANTWNMQAVGGSWGNGEMKPNALYRDTSAWYHHVLRIDTTESTQADRIRQYVNGERITSYNTESLTGNLTSSESLSYINQSGVVQAWGGLSGKGHGTEGADLQMAEIVFCDGQSYGPDSFGETKNGVWIPKDPSGLTFGNNGYWLKMAAGAIGTDSSGNGNNFTVANIAAHDVMLDSPTFNSDSNGGNFATYNPLQTKGSAQALMVLTEGNLQAESVTSDKYHQIIGNMGVKTGKWYIEWYILAAGYPSWAVGWHYGDGLELFNGSSGQAGTANMAYMGYFTGSTVYLTPFGNTGTNPVAPSYSSFTNQGAPTTGDVIMCAIDYDAGKGWWGINGVWGDVGSGTGNPATGANASLTWTASDYTDYKFPFTLSWANPVAKIVMNCGQEGTFGGAITAGGNSDDTGYGNFKYDVPAGFLSLCSGNLPVADEIDPAQTDDNYPQKQFNMLQYTGNGSERTIDTGFQIDMAWARSTIQGQDWYVLDTSRGFFGASSNNKYLKLNVYPGQAEATLPQYNFKAQSGSDITITGGTWLNSNTHTQQMWNWKGNGGTTSTPSGGSLATTVQVNTDAGFSIIQYVGDGGTSAFTLAHGLGKKPSVVLFKDRDSNSNNNGYHVFPINTSLPANSYFYTSDSDAGNTSTNGTISNSTTTDTVLGINRTSSSGGGRTISENGDNFLMYAWAEIEGFSKFSVYLGNNLADGTFVYCGFKPAFIAIKNYDEAHNWRTYDLLNDPYNLAYHYLELNTNSAINSSSNTTDIDILSNGFKIRGDASTINGSGDRYFFMAWASNPFKYATAR